VKRCGNVPNISNGSKSTGALGFMTRISRLFKVVHVSEVTVRAPGGEIVARGASQINTAMVNKTGALQNTRTSKRINGLSRIRKNFSIKETRKAVLRSRLHRYCVKDVVMDPMRTARKAVVKRREIYVT
jgi:hypothetical protein